MITITGTQFTATLPSFVIVIVDAVEGEIYSGEILTLIMKGDLLVSKRGWEVPDLVPDLAVHLNSKSEFLGRAVVLKS
jgi:hypothetical protein